MRTPCRKRYTPLVAITIALAACTFTYQTNTTRFRAALACVDFTGPGFAFKCPQDLQTPPLPDNQRPPPPPTP